MGLIALEGTKKTKTMGTHLSPYTCPSFKFLSNQNSSGEVFLSMTIHMIPREITKTHNFEVVDFYHVFEVERSAQV